MFGIIFQRLPKTFRKCPVSMYEEFQPTAKINRSRSFIASALLFSCPLHGSNALGTQVLAGASQYSSSSSRLSAESSPTLLSFSTSTGESYGASKLLVSASTSEDNQNEESTRKRESEMENKKKSVDDLRIQWAGGRDIWPEVPLHMDEIVNDKDREKMFVSIQTRVVTNNSGGRDPSSDHDTSQLQWPKIVLESTLYGFGAYNPRGQVVPNDINVRQHGLLKADIEVALAKYASTSASQATYWEAAAIWDDGSSERGFMLAFQQYESLEKDLEMNIVLELAKKYDQGAIYRYRLEHEEVHNGDEVRIQEKLMRDTIAVLDKGSDARVEIEMDKLNSGVDLSPFL